MRELRAAPAKILRRALRTGAPIHVGDFVIEVKSSAPLKGTIFGAMHEGGSRLPGGLAFR